MDRNAKFIAALKRLQGVAPIQVWPATVKSIQGTNCTVDILNTDLIDVDEVNLRADDEATEGVLIVPRVGSLVYVGAVENAVDNLFVCQVSEVDRVEVKIGNSLVTIDKDQVKAVRDKCELTLSDKATLKQDQTTIELSSGKVKINNSATSLKSVLDDLTSLLQNFTVTCAAPGSPSAPFPATITQVTQLSTKINQLLS
ncbi:hypothetical protein [Spirosoma aerolatum]|uniref:hypothetical protein n=1 Tax=Spirosoma aerolatum TaxID=1211326 RepID=UPI0009AC8DD3|nr:hypothetical protein [Spirosoma aerolatum]